MANEDRHPSQDAFQCDFAGCTRHPSKGDTITRISPKGQPFRGLCDEHYGQAAVPVAFEDELRVLINHHSKENGSNTPDYILARYLSECLKAFDLAVVARDVWYGRAQFGDGVAKRPELSPSTVESRESGPNEPA